MKALLLCVGLVFTGMPRTSDVFWDNGKHDGVTGFLSLRQATESWVADDFVAQTPLHVTAVTGEFYVNLHGQKPFELADIGVWRQPIPGKEPTDLVLELDNLPIEWERVDEGFGLPIISVRVSNLDISLPPGDYYFGIRLVADNEHGGDAWLCTTGKGAIRGWNGGWWFWWNPPHWEPVWWKLSKPLRASLATSDFAFALYGERD